MHSPPLPQPWPSHLPFPSRSFHSSLPSFSPSSQPHIVRPSLTCPSLLLPPDSKPYLYPIRKSSCSCRSFCFALEWDVVRCIDSTPKCGNGVHPMFVTPIGCDSKLVCKASGPSNDDQDNLSDEEDAFYSVQENLVSSDHSIRASNIQDWRSFRARLVAAENAGGESLEMNNAEVLANKWAHPILVPETGCLLIATEKLDGQAPFERSVILLLRLGSSQPQDGPFGVILNRPILHTINDFEPITEKMVQILRNSLLFYGGPLATHIFLVKQDVEGFDELEEIMPGIHYGFSNGSQLQHLERFMMANGNKGHFRNFLGYAGWDFHQLEEEIAQGFWHVAASSPDLIMETPSESLWKEVLMAMGGDYAELSKKGMGGT